MSTKLVTLNNWHYNLCANSFVSRVPEESTIARNGDCCYNFKCCRGPALYLCVLRKKKKG